jgi:hypothetical protein
MLAALASCPPWAGPVALGHGQLGRRARLGSGRAGHEARVGWAVSLESAYFQILYSFLELV